MLANTLVVWMGEFGRTPVINGTAGRDHFPLAWSTVLAGAGVKGGQAVGSTGKDGIAVAGAAGRGRGLPRHRLHRGRRRPGHREPHLGRPTDSPCQEGGKGHRRARRMKVRLESWESLPRRLRRQPSPARWQPAPRRTTLPHRGTTPSRCATCSCSSTTGRCICGYASPSRESRLRPCGANTWPSSSALSTSTTTAN